MIKYNPIENIEEQIFDCCDTPQPTDPSCDCCYNTWQKDLEKVSAEWKKAKSKAEVQQLEYDSNYQFYSKIKIWCDDWAATDEKADTLYGQLNLFIYHLNKICEVTEKSGKAIEILFCMIKDLFIRIDKLKEDYDELMQCIACLKSPELAPGVGIVKCLEEYGKKLDAVIALRDIILKSAILSLEYAYILNGAICDKYGLKNILVYWKDILYPKNSGDGCPPQNGNNCDLSPVISLPIEYSKYFTDLVAERNSLKTTVENLAAKRDRLNKQKDALLAGKESLEAAIKEINPKERCS